jgi:hypothetical protein
MGRSGNGLVKEGFGRGVDPNYPCVVRRRRIAWPIPNPVADPTTPPSTPAWISRRVWLAVPLLALVFAAWVTAIRARKVEYVSHVAGAAARVPGAAAGARAAPWQPTLIVPGHVNESYEWIDQTRQMFAQRELRVRHIDYENAPFGREVFAASPYRWWLGFVALAYHGITRAPMGPSVEWAALYADPILLLAFGALTVLFVAWRFGVLAASLASAALATLFPLAAGFLPGVPDDVGLAVALALWSILPLLAGAASAGAPGTEHLTRRWFVAAGVIGGVGLWVNVPRQVPIIVGIAIGALLAAWIARIAAGKAPGASRPALPWRTWSVAGATTCLAAYIVEYFPSHMGAWELHAIHPLFGLTWLGGGELLARTTAWLGGERPRWKPKSIAVLLLGAAGLASLPVAMVILKSPGFLSMELPTMRLSLIAGGPAAPTLLAWMLQNGVTGPVLATILPLLLLIPAALLLILKSFGAGVRVPIAIAMGPVLAAAAFSCRQISWWNGVDAAVLALLVATAAALSALPRPRLVAVLAAAFAALMLVPGALQVWPSADERARESLTETEVVGLVERDMAYWLASHAGPSGAVVVAPPNLTATLYYYSGVRGLASFSWEDRDGFQSAVRIMSATTPEEAQELIGIHGVTDIIIPSWDPFMDAYAQVGAGQVAGTFLDRLHQWNLPRWLQPVPYLVPTIPGFEGQSAIVLEVVDEQDDATALSRIAEFFVDMGQLTLATKAEGGLRRFPADLGALLARAQVQFATGDSDEFAKSVEILVRRIAGGADKDLQWDQRVGLAVVLTQAHRVDLARPRLQQCLEEIDESKLRSLSTVLLYRLQVLRKALGLDIADPKLRSLSLELLPSDLRSRVEGDVQK